MYKCVCPCTTFIDGSIYPIKIQQLYLVIFIKNFSDVILSKQMATMQHIMKYGWQPKLYSAVRRKLIKLQDTRKIKSKRTF